MNTREPVIEANAQAAALQVIVVTGMSGAGRSTALHVLEDLGFFCVDNLPPELAPQLVESLARGGDLKRLALGIDVRTGSLLEGADEVLDTLVAKGHELEVLFLDCADGLLVRRYSESRRPHPLAPGGNLMQAIQQERERLGSLRTRATRVIDTTRLNVHDLRRLLVDYVARGAAPAQMITRVLSFGFKFGLPADADLVFDLRYLPNPHFVAELQPHPGTDPRVSEFVLRAPETQELLEDVSNLLRKMLPRYEREGKAYLTVAVGCTGGKHRSVAFAEALGRALQDQREIVVVHRDVTRQHS